MKAIPILLLCCSLILLAPDLSAQDEDEVEVYIFQRIDHETLDKVANQLALMGGITIEVEAKLKGKKISLELEDPLTTALERVAAAAGAHLVRKGPKSYAIRSEPPGDEPAEEPEAVPEWVKPLAKLLEETEVTYTWKGEPLPEVLAWLSKESGVRIRLDPRVSKERSKADLAIHIAQYDENLKPLPTTSSAATALNMALAYPTVDLARVWRFGGVWVSTREHIRKLPPVKQPSPGDSSSELQKKVDAAVVTVKLKGATLAKAIESIGKRAGVKIELDRDLRGEFKADRIDLDVAATPLRDVLDLILAPRGLIVAPTDQGLAVRRAPE